MQPVSPTQVESPSPDSNKKQSAFFNPIKSDIGNRQNLIDPVTIVGTSGISSVETWKAIAVDVFTILFAGAFSYSFARYLAGGFSFWFVLGALLLWGSASVIEGFLQKSFSHRSWIMLVESLALVGFFYDYAWQALAITAIVSFFFLGWGYVAIRRALDNTIEIRFFAVSGKILGKIITAAVIFMIIMYASLSNDRGNFFVSQDGFNTFFNWTAGFVNNFYPTVPLTGSFGDFAQAVARMQLQGNPQFQALTPDEQDAALSNATQQVMNTFSPEATSTAAPAGAAPASLATSTPTTVTPTPAIVPVSPSEPTTNAFYNYFASLFMQLQNKFGNAFIGVWGLVLFLALRSAAIIAVWVAQFVALVFYEFLLAVGFMKISEETASKETIGY